MQITLIQAEIEAAITNFVTSQVNVRPEMRIDVDLTATRGANGFTATIDIVHKNSPRIAKDGTKVIPVTLAHEDEPMKEQPAEEPAPQVAVATPVAVPEAPQAAAEEKPANPLAQPERPRSLFAGMQKPTNPS